MLLITPKNPKTQHTKQQPLSTETMSSAADRRALLNAQYAERIRLEQEKFEAEARELEELERREAEEAEKAAEEERVRLEREAEEAKRAVAEAEEAARQVALEEANKQ